MSGGRQQVVFIERVLWGGGAERVVYDLAHGLDPARFEPVVVTMFRQQNLPVEFRDDIRLCCFDFPQEAGLPYGAASPPGNVSTISLVRRLRRMIRPRTRWKQVRSMLADAKQRLLPANRSGQAAPPLPPRDMIAEWLPVVMEAEMPRVRALRNVLATFDDDCLLVPVMEEAAVMTWLLQPFMPRQYICSLHTNESDQFPRMYPDASHRAVMQWLFRGACLGADRVTIPSAGSRADLIANFALPAEHVRLMVNPVDAAAIREKSQQPAADADRWKNKCLFVHVARLCCQKNHDLLLDACRRLRARFDDFVVLCLGDGHRREELTRLIAGSGLERHILLPGHAANPFPYMAAARGLLLTSHYEGFSLVLVEGLICGCVPVSVDCPTGPREVLDGGRCGLLVPPNDPQAFADAMYNVAHDDALCRRLLDAGRAQAAQYDAAEVVRQWNEMLGKN